MELQPVDFPEHVEQHDQNRLDAIRAFAAAHHPAPPFLVEIGSNRGRFLQELAALYPDHSVVGIEWRGKWADTIAQECAARGITNAHLLVSDARYALPLLFPDGAISAIFILFPDPWWKRRHAKRRLFTPAFFQLLASKLAPGGHLIIKTDVEPYAASIEAQLDTCAAQLARVTPSDDAYPADAHRWPRTTREAKIIRKQLPVWDIFLRRTDAPTLDLQDIPEPPDAERFPKPDVIIDNPRA